MLLTESQEQLLLQELPQIAKSLAASAKTVRIDHYQNAETMASVLGDRANIRYEFHKLVNLRMARELSALGASFYVQVFDQQAFFDFLAGRPNTRELFEEFQDVARQFRGEAALQLLRLTLDEEVQVQSSDLTEADLQRIDQKVRQLFDAWLEDPYESDFSVLINSCLEDDPIVIQVALRVAAQLKNDAFEHFSEFVMMVAEELRYEWDDDDRNDRVITLWTVPAFPGFDGKLPSIEEMQTLFYQSEMFGKGKVAVIPRWFPLADVFLMSPVDVRDILVDTLDGVGSIQLRPVEIPSHLEHLASGQALLIVVDTTDEERDELASDDQEAGPVLSKEKGLDWLHQVLAAYPDIGIATPSLPSVLPGVIDTLLGGGDVDESEGTSELYDFLNVVQREVGKDEILCRAVMISEGYDIVLSTSRGDVLDRRVFAFDDLPVLATEVPEFLARYVTLVEELPQPKRLLGEGSFNRTTVSLADLPRPKPRLVTPGSALLQ